MRYTTIIDIRDIPEVWRNVNIREVYYYLSLSAGYHDNDRDIARKSLHSIAIDVGITLSATRHALRVLQQANLISKRDDGALLVRKWIVDTPPTPRRQNKQRTVAAGDIGGQLDKQISDYQQQVMQAVRASSKDELKAWLAELQQGRSLRHHGAQIRASEDNINWLKNIILKL